MSPSIYIKEDLKYLGLGPVGATWLRQMTENGRNKGDKALSLIVTISIPFIAAFFLNLTGPGPSYLRRIFMTHDENLLMVAKFN